MAVALRRSGLIASMSWLVVWVFVGVVWAAVYPIGSSSEAREAHVVQDILYRGQWLLPTRNGIIPSKPPLYHWLSALMGLVAAVPPHVLARGASVMSGAWMILLTVSLGQKYGRSDDSSEVNFGVVSGLILATSYLFVNLATNARVDMLLGVLMLAGISALLPWIAHEESWNKRPWQADVVFWISAGLATLVKGPIAIVLPSAVISIALWVEFGWRSAWNWGRKPTIGWIFAFLIPFAWYGYAAYHWQSAFIERQFLFENLQRLTGGTEHMNTEAWWFYGPSFLRSSFPWSLVFIASLCDRRFDKQRFRPLILWVGAGLLLLSCAAGKRHSYVLPLLPPMVVVVAAYGSFLTGGWSAERARTWVRNVTIGEQVFVIITGIIVCCWQLMVSAGWGAPDIRSQEIASWVRQNLWLLLASWILLLAMARYAGRRRYGWAVIGAFMLLVGTSFGLAIKNLNKDFVSTAESITALSGGSGMPLTVVKHPFDEYLDPVLYYLGTSIAVVAPENAQLPPTNTWIITKREILDLWIAQGRTPAVLQRYFEVSARLNAEKPEDPRQVVLVRFD